jgi:hypothetical protein
MTIYYLAIATIKKNNTDLLLLVNKTIIDVASG